MKKKKNHNAMRMLVLISQLGICMLVSILFCVYLGQLLSQKFHSDVLFPMMLLIGIMAGFRSCYMMISRFVNLGKEKKISEESEITRKNTGKNK